MNLRQPLLAFALAAIFLAGCDGILSVNNPGAIQQDELTDPSMEQLIVNGVVGEFQYTHTYASQWTAVFTDELLLDHTYFPTIPVALRTIEDDNVYVGNLYSFWQRVRASADDGIERLEDILGEDAQRNLNVAHVHAVGGYAYVLLGETFCEAPIDQSPAYSSDDLIEMSLPHFDNAIATAQAARDGGADAATASDVINLANLGAARALLNLGRMDEAIAYASEVDEGFEWWILHSENSAREYNAFHGPTTGSRNRYLAVGKPFENLGDPRITHTHEQVTSLTGAEMFVPRQPINFEGWQPGAWEDESNLVPFERDTDVRFASGLEAQYILAEAQGPTDATLLFVNERREAGNQEPVSLSGDELMAELREQRARDFYLTGKRLGDLRRYRDLYGVNLFPTGIDPYQDQEYGDETCFPIPQSERNANPNL